MLEIGSNEFHIFGHLLSPYGIAMSVSIVFQALYLDWEKKRERLRSDYLFVTWLIVVVSSIIGARLVYVLTDLPYFLKNPLAVFNVTAGGLVLYGGFLLGPFAGYWYTRRVGANYWYTFDLAVTPLALTIIFVRLGCFFNGCCFGSPTSLLWVAVYREGTTPYAFYGEKVPIHPTQVYESLAGLLLTLVLHFVPEKKKPFHGFKTLLFMTLYPIFRFIIEFFRGDAYRGRLGPFSTSQWISIGFLVFVAVMYPILSKINKVGKVQTVPESFLLESNQRRKA